jgi:hypothetical protein
MSDPSRPLKWQPIKDAEAASGRDLIIFRRCCGHRSSVSLTEIEAAVKELSRKELAKLAAFIARQNKLVWDEELEQDFSPGGKHAAALGNRRRDWRGKLQADAVKSHVRLLRSGDVVTNCQGMCSDSRERNRSCSRQTHDILR